MACYISQVSIHSASCLNSLALLPSRTLCLALCLSFCIFVPLATGFLSPISPQFLLHWKPVCYHFKALLAGAVGIENKAQGGTDSMGHFPWVPVLATRQMLPYLGCMKLVGLCPPAQRSLYGRPMCRVISLLFYLLHPSFLAHSAVMFLSCLVCLPRLKETWLWIGIYCKDADVAYQLSSLWRDVWCGLNHFKDQ